MKKILTISILFILITSPSKAIAVEDDYGWTYAGNSHPEYFVMNKVNEGIIYFGCWPDNHLNPYDLQVMENVKVKNTKKYTKKWKTVAKVYWVKGKLNFQNNGSSLKSFECQNKYQSIAVWQWSPKDWKKDYKMRLVPKYSEQLRSIKFDLLIHPDLRAIK